MLLSTSNLLCGKIPQGTDSPSATERSEIQQLETNCKESEAPFQNLQYYSSPKKESPSCDVNTSTKKKSSRRKKNSTALRDFDKKRHRSKSHRNAERRGSNVSQASQRESDTEHSESSSVRSTPRESRRRRSSTRRHRSSRRDRDTSDSESHSNSESSCIRERRRSISRSRKSKDLDDSLHRSMHRQPSRRDVSGLGGYAMPFDYKIGEREGIKRTKSDGVSRKLGGEAYSKNSRTSGNEKEESNANRTASHPEAENHTSVTAQSA